MKDIRIVFMGTPAVSARILEGLSHGGWNIVGVATQPDKPRGRGRIISPSPVREAARARGIEVLQPATMKDPAFLDRLRALAPDLIVTAAFGKILPAEVLTLPRLGCFNVHFSLLPAYRGPAPVQRAILNGETTGGITIFRMDEGCDTGPVLANAPLAISADDTAGTLTERLVVLAAETLPQALREVIQGKAKLIPQDPGKATYAPTLEKEEGRIHWNLHAEEIRNRIRGLNPWPGTFTFWKGRRLMIWDATTELSVAPPGDPGEVLGVAGEGLRVRTGGGILVVRSVQLEGKTRVNVSDFLKGHPVKAGERFHETP